MEASVNQEELACGMAHSAEDQLPITTNVIAEVTNQLKSKLRCGPPTSGGVNGCCTAVIPPSPDCVHANGLQRCSSDYTCVDSDPRYWSYSCDGNLHREQCHVACFGDCVPAALQQPDVRRPPSCGSPLDSGGTCASCSAACEANTRTHAKDPSDLSKCCLGHQQGLPVEPVIHVQSSPTAALGCDHSVQEATSIRESESEVQYVGYESEHQMPDIMRLIQKDLSEPYSIYTYRYFIHNWPKLCFLAMDGNNCIGAIVCKLDMHKKMVKRGYIAMLAVDEKYRKRKIGSNLVLKAIHAMIQNDADEVVLETEVTNKPALRLYENLGFVRDKRLFRYYLNGVDALRLKLWLR